MPVTRSQLRRWGTSLEVAASAGIVAATCWSVALRGLLTLPGIDQTEADVAAFYGDPDNYASVPVQLALVIVGTVSFLWFVGVVRSRLGRHEQTLAGTVFLGASILLAGMLLVGTSGLAGPALLAGAGADHPDPSAVLLGRSSATVLLALYLPRIATVVMFTAAALGHRTGVFPRWLVVLTLVVGVAEFVNVTVASPTIYVFPAWLGLTSVVLLVRTPRSRLRSP